MSPFYTPRKHQKTEGFKWVWNRNIHCTKKGVFLLRIFSVNVTKPQIPADLVLFTDEILNGKLHYFVQWLVRNGLTKSQKRTQRFSGVFRGYEMGSLTWNGLKLNMQTSKNTTLLKRTYINRVVTLLNYLLDSLIVFVTTNFSLFKLIQPEKRPVLQPLIKLMKINMQCFINPFTCNVENWPNIL